METKYEITDFNEWLEFGQSKGWVTDLFCNTHEGPPILTEEEDLEWQEGGDPCQFCVRIIE